MADYPGSLPSFTNPSPGDPANDASATDATVVVAKIHGELAAALAELGTDPAGASATVKARLDALDSTVSGKADASTLAETIRDTMGTALVAGSNVTITVNDAGDTITIAASGGGGGLTEEEVEDVVNGLLVAGANISLTYDDAANTLTVAVTGLGSAAALSTADIDERARDAVGTALTAGTGITVTPNDGADTITVATSALLPTLVDAKGDLLVGTAADTVARLAVGATNGHVLTVDSAEAAGMKWAAAAGGSSAGVLLSGTTAPTGGSDGDWYLRYDGNREVAALYGPKAAGSWPTDPDLILGSTRAVSFSNLAGNDGDAYSGNSGMSYPGSAGGGFRIGFGTPSSAPSPNVSHVSNVSYSSGIMRGASAAVGYWTGIAFQHGLTGNLPLMAHCVATVAALPNGTSTNRMGVGFYNATFVCGQYAYISQGGKFGIWSTSAGVALVETTPGSAPAAGDIITVQFMGQFAQAQLFSSAGVLKSEVKAPRGGVTFDTMFGNRLGVVFDSTNDTTGKFTNFLGVC